MSITFDRTLYYGPPQLSFFTSTDDLATIETQNYMQALMGECGFTASDILIIKYVDSGPVTGFFKVSVDGSSNVTVTQVLQF